MADHYLEILEGKALVLFGCNAGTLLGKDNENTEEITFDSVRNGPVYNRIKVLQYTTMFKMYSETMQDYNENLLKYRDKCSSLLHQQRRLLRKEISSQELDDLLDSPETSLFVDNILVETRLAKQQLSELETRHDELKKLEKSIVEIRDLFLEMAFLVEKQGEQLNCVEYFASKATDDIDNGRGNLNKANEKKRKGRMRKMTIALIVSIILVIILLMILCS